MLNEFKSKIIVPYGGGWCILFKRKRKNTLNSNSKEEYNEFLRGYHKNLLFIRSRYIQDFDPKHRLVVILPSVDGHAYWQEIDYYRINWFDWKYVPDCIKNFLYKQKFGVGLKPKKKVSIYGDDYIAILPTSDYTDAGKLGYTECDCHMLDLNPIKWVSSKGFQNYLYFSDTTDRFQEELLANRPDIFELNNDFLYKWYQEEIKSVLGELMTFEN